MGQDKAPAPRRLQVPAGCSSWWGVDLAVRRIDVVSVSREGERRGVTMWLDELDGAERLWRAFEGVRDRTTDALVAGTLPRPGVVMVEHPAGSSPNMELLYLSGAVQGGMYAGIALAGAPAVRVLTIPVSRWKKIACGRGDLYKPDPKKGRTGPYGVLVWAQANGYEGNDDNVADAMGIAEAARRTIELVER